MDAKNCSNSGEVISINANKCKECDEWLDESALLSQVHDFTLFDLALSVQFLLDSNYELKMRPYE